jgi:DNA polymerase-3 subunit beta
MAVSAQVRGRVEAQGEYTVPAKLLQDYVSLLPAGKVELVLVDDVLEVRADGSSTTIKGMPSSEFPLIPKLAKDSGYHLKADAFRNAIGQVAFAVSGSESRPELSGVACFFHGQVKGSLVMAATDSYRLSERVLALEASGQGSEGKCIVPARAMQEAARILSSYKDDVGMPEQVEWSITDSQMVMTYGNVELISRLIESSFPDYRQLIPAQFKSTITISRSDIQKAIRAASLFSRQGLFDIHFDVLPGEGLKVSSADTGTGAHKTTLNAEIEGDANKVILNYRYISDGLAVMGTDQVVVRMIDAMNPVVVTPKDQEGFRYIVMPIRQ